MPTNITLKNVPEEIHLRLREAAQAHRRSVNSEAIVCLEQVLCAKSLTVEDELRRIRALRAGIPSINLNNDEINELKNAGRR